MKSSLCLISDIPRAELFDQGWLSPGERSQLERFSSLERRREWLAGRWTLKQMLLARRPGVSPGDLSIESLENGRRTMPRVTWHGKPDPVSVSISHGNGWVMAAISDDSTMAVGCDLVARNQLIDRLEAFWYTDREQHWLASQLDMASKNEPAQRSSDQSLLIWALKEAFYKAMGNNVSFRPRQWDVLSILDDWGLKLCCPIPAHGQRLRSQFAVLDISVVQDCLAVCFGCDTRFVGDTQLIDDKQRFVKTRRMATDRRLFDSRSLSKTHQARINQQPLTTAGRPGN